MAFRKIGILGGMGPEATLLLQSRLIAAVEAQDDADHIPLLIDMNPQVPSRIAFLLEGGDVDPAPILVQMARSLEAAGAAALAMPCNTAHTFSDDITRAVEIPLLNMPELAVNALSKRCLTGGHIGILASPATQKVNLFGPFFTKHNMQQLFPENQNELLNAIRTIKSDGATPEAITTLKRNGEELVARGAEALLIACSEFSLISQDLKASVPIIDTLDVLVSEIVSQATM